MSSASQIFIYKWPITDEEDDQFRKNFEAAKRTAAAQDDCSTAEEPIDPFSRIYVNTNSDDLFVLQEQISEFLDVKSFKRKYPDIERRFTDVKERVFLRDFGVVTETVCDLGLNALKLGDVMDLMSREYPDKYVLFSAHLAEKRRKAVNAVKQGHVAAVAAAQSAKRSADSGANSGQRAKDLIRKAMQSVANYNAQLAREKKEERSACFDLQTMVSEIA
jgi:uncharacterized protein YeeX (DUF496 family)